MNTHTCDATFTQDKDLAIHGLITEVSRLVNLSHGFDTADCQIIQNCASDLNRLLLGKLSESSFKAASAFNTAVLEGDTR